MNQAQPVSDTHLLIGCAFFCSNLIHLANSVMRPMREFPILPNQNPLT